jgi:hypothetical protein
MPLVRTIALLVFSLSHTICLSPPPPLSSLDVVDFITKSICHSSDPNVTWTCVGDGMDDNYMSFVGKDELDMGQFGEDLTSYRYPL